MSSAHPKPLVPRRPVGAMTDAEIDAEYQRCRRPDGKLDQERFAEMAARIYGHPLREAEAPSEERASALREFSELLATWEREPAPDDEPDWEIIAHNPFEIRVVERA